MAQHETYLRNLQNAYNELMQAYKALETLEQKRTDTGMQITAEHVANFPHLTADNVANAQFTFVELKTLFDAGHRSNINKILP